MSGVLDGAAKYLVHHPLGRGGMGIVHLGTMVSPAGERRVAIKQLLTKENKEAAARIIAEARLVFQLTHANICQVLDLALSDVGTFIVMELVDGCDLRTLIQSAKLTVPAAVYIAREVAKGLDYAHRRRDAGGNALWLIHGDVTPQNILLSREGEVKLADFGIARALGSINGTEAPGNQLTAGTPGFVAPEALIGESDQRADVYSLGVTLYCALTHLSPKEGIDLKLLERDPNVSQELLMILRRATAPLRDDRYATSAEFEKALSLLLHHYPSFTASSLAEVVPAHDSQPFTVTESAELTSLTGTATFVLPGGLAASRVGGDARQQLPDPPRGTVKVALRSRKRAEPSRRRRAILLSAFGSALALVALTRVPSRNVSAIPAATTNASPPAPMASNPAGLTPPPAKLPAPKPETLPVPPSVPSPPLKNIRHVQPTKRAHVSAKPVEGATTTEMGYLTVDSEPWGMVYVDGRRFSELTPVYRAPIVAGSHRVWVFSPDKRKQSAAQTITVRAAETRVLGFKW